MKSQGCILQLDAAGSAAASELSQLPLADSARWAGRGQLWLCSPPLTAAASPRCQTSVFHHPSPGSAQGGLLLRGMFLRLQFSGLRMLCPATRHSLLLLLGSCTGRGGRQLGSVALFMPETAPAPCLCPFPIQPQWALPTQAGRCFHRVRRDCSVPAVPRLLSSPASSSPCGERQAASAALALASPLASSRSLSRPSDASLCGSETCL